MNKEKPTPQYLGFTSDHDPWEARQIFAKRFGVEPEEYFIHNSLLVGPIPDPEAK